MSVIITGAGGQLGQDMVRACKKRNIPAYPADSRQVDITDYQAVKKFLKGHHCDLLINCAAYNAVDQAEKDWKMAFSVNGLGVRNLALAVKECRGVLIHYSTDFVFDGDAGRPYTIADIPHPINRYGESKLLGENYICNHSERYYLIRVSWVFGEGRGKTNFVKKVIEWSKSANELRIVDDQISSPTYTVDLAEATLDLIDTGMYGLYHVTNRGYCSRYEWANYILSGLGWQGRIIPVSSKEFHTPAKRPRFSALDNFGFAEIVGHNLPHWKNATNRFLEEVNNS